MAHSRQNKWLANCLFLFICTLVPIESVHSEEPQEKTAQQAAATALKVGDQAIDGVLIDGAGKEVQLSDLWKEGPLVVIWYRGGWCPICMRHLRGIQEAMPQIKEAGAKIVAIAPELPEMSKQTAEKNGFDFLLLSDKGNTLGEKYGIVFKLDPGTATRYQQLFDLEKFNGDASMELPVPVAYVINEKGVITFAYVEPDYRQRVKPGDIVDALKTTPAN
ncbi:peroxiredoxin-like family protein [Bythopirellula polymerisocia]|uniref:thioredoxin-dependent peroxiredoxin n=1 Tax=Bythopirellula polymerisocia TaxID=2528003 RepID=A0A5C6CPK9_9BACT|nr:peroxiredoxin-like family protein [Bythopirellula polymerisocia]TWU25965.1 putative peroxiredoxin bcp [Bythopirellula polymerisocia]